MRAGTVPVSTAIGAGALALLAVLLPPTAYSDEGLGAMPGSGDFGLLLIALAGCCVLFTKWPWMVLPTTIVGTVAVVGDGSLRLLLVVHGLFIVAGLFGLVIRRLVLCLPETRARTAADLPMAMVVVVILAGSIYGLIVGNDPEQVVISGYHFAVIPLYFFLATYTLNTPARLRSGGLLFVVLSALLTITAMAAPGRHGGAWSLMAALPLLVLSCRAQGWRRAGLMALGALYLADVVLASFRTTWTLTVVALLVILAGGRRNVRWAVGAITAATATLLVVLLAVSEGVRDRAAVVVIELGQDSGYRVPEALVGLRTFIASPLVGSGMGQTTPDVYIPGFEVADVGPLYHVYYVMILANLGLVGLVVVLWPIVRALRVGLAERDTLAFAFAALICGFLVSVAFSGPATGHWALGLLPALVLLTRKPADSADDLPQPATEQAAPLVEAR